MLAVLLTLLVLAATSLSARYEAQHSQQPLEDMISALEVHLTTVPKGVQDRRPSTDCDACRLQSTTHWLISFCSDFSVDLDQKRLVSFSDDSYPVWITEREKVCLGHFHTLISTARRFWFFPVRLFLRKHG